MTGSESRVAQARLALGSSASYVAHFVQTRGVDFASSVDFLSSVRLTGGEGILIERLSVSDLVPTINSRNADHPYAHFTR